MEFWDVVKTARRIMEGTHDDLPSVKSIDLNKLAHESQKVYDEWDQSDEEYGDPELGFGGICQDIADAMAGVLNGAGIDAETVSASVGDQHVYVVAKLREGVYSVDIPPGVYESGGGYTWKKRDGVRFTRHHIALDRLDADPDEFERYTEE